MMNLLKIFAGLPNYFKRMFPAEKGQKAKSFPAEEAGKKSIISARDLTETKQAAPEPAVNPLADECPYCRSRDIVKRGWRRKKYEKAQLYLCNACKKTFTAQRVKGKSFPLRIILEGLSFYNIGYSLEESCQRLKEEFGLNITASTLNEWVKEFAPLCRYARIRPFALKLFGPNQVIQTTHLYHHQVYDFSVHRAKLAILLQEYRNNKFDNLRELLEAVQSECPHQFFKDGERASELKVDFNLQEVIIKEKQNFATRIAGLALQAVSDNKLRHKTLQNFMLANDSVTVAVEVPVYMDEMDIEHMQEELGFKIPLKLDKVLTGHIDVLQLRNGAVHILDYKPQGAKEKIGSRALTQLTLYALMLSRLTGLRLYDFKCAWFDENSYFEFFPLHVVYKLRERAGKEHPDQMKFGELIETAVLSEGKDVI
jgi:transposase-like protein